MEIIKKINNRIESVTNVAAIRLKITALNGKLSEYCEQLGQLAYEKAIGTTEDDCDTRFESLVTLISGVLTEKKDLENKLLCLEAEKKLQKTKEEYQELLESLKENQQDN